MPTRAFTITADAKAGTLSAGSCAEASITVTNTSGRQLRGQARVVALGQTKAAWLTIGGEVERDFALNEAHQFVLKLTLPAGTAPGKYSARLNVVSVQNPDDDFAEGPVVSFVVAEDPAPAQEPKRKSSWLFWLILALILLGGGLAGYFLTLPKPDFTFTPEKPLTNFEITFTNSTSGSGASPHWTITGKDGSTVFAIGDGDELKAKLANPGTYKVTLSVSHLGREFEVSKELEVAKFQIVVPGRIFAEPFVAGTAKPDTPAESRRQTFEFRFGKFGPDIKTQEAILRSAGILPGNTALKSRLDRSQSFTANMTKEQAEALKKALEKEGASVDVR